MKGSVLLRQPSPAFPNGIVNNGESFSRHWRHKAPPTAKSCCREQQAFRFFVPSRRHRQRVEKGQDAASAADRTCIPIHMILADR